MQVAQETKLYEKRQKLENLNKTLTKIRPKQPDFVKGLAAFVGTPPQQQPQGKYRQQQQIAPPNLGMDFAFGLQPPLKGNKKSKQRMNQPFFG